MIDGASRAFCLPKTQYKGAMNLKTALIQSALEKLLSMFQNQQFPAELGWQIIRRRKGDHPLPSDAWSAGNRLIMLASGTKDARGFSQWRDAGRRVKPGSKALYIAAPITRKYKSETGQVSAETDDTAIVIVGFRWLPVFRLEDTIGKPLPEIEDLTPQVLPPLFDVAAKLGVSAIKYVPFDGRALGVYNVGRQEIRLSENKSPQVFYHEVMHHLDFQTEPIRPGRLCEAELIAELGASVICAIQGISGFEAGSFRYLQMYAEGKEPEAVLKSLMTVAARVEQLVGVVLDAAEEYQISPGLPSQEAVPATA